MAALGFDTEAALPPEEPLTIYGFADVSYHGLLTPYTHPVAGLTWKENSFAVGNVNMYVTRKFASSWRVMLELRFLYAPNGSVDGTGTIMETRAPDAADFGRDLDWGGIEIERAYIEYELHPRLPVQAGSFLTPYGIWNVDHGSPVIIGTTRPYIIGDQLFPERQTGLQFYGALPLGEYTLGYHATLSNGRGPYQSFRDLDDNKAAGGRLTLEMPLLGTLRLGASAYAGRYADRESDYLRETDAGEIRNTTPRGVRFKEVAYALDLLWTYHGVQLQAEFIAQDIRYLNGARARGHDDEGFAVDGRAYGGYGLGGYRFEHLWNVMPYVSVEHYRPIDGTGAALVDHSLGVEALLSVSAGLNFRPHSNIVLKLQYTNVSFPDSRGLAAETHLRILGSQVACAF